MTATTIPTVERIRNLVEERDLRFYDESVLWTGKPSNAGESIRWYNRKPLLDEAGAGVLREALLMALPAWTDKDRVHALYVLRSCPAKEA